MRASPRIVFIGPLPPPVTGQTAVTGYICDAFGERGVSVAVANTAPRHRGRTWRNRLTRLKGLCTAFILIPVERLRRAQYMYVVVNDGLGMYHTIICVIMARLLGFHMLLHHHCASYARSRKLRMTLLAACAGKAAVHVTLCEAMSADVERQYRGRPRTFVLGNAVAVPLSDKTDGRASEGQSKPISAIRLGHLSNLRMDKGLDVVIDVLRALLGSGRNAHLSLAGPPASEQEHNMVTAAQQELGTRLTYLGPVSGPSKAKFFHEIDVFLFPSRYINEAQPLVCLEAMAAGVPVIAFDWGYVSSAVGREGGVLVPPGGDFVEKALPVLHRWQEQPGCLQSASRAARTAFREMHRLATAQVEQLVAMVAQR